MKISQIDILFIVFTHTENGERCSERGWKDLSTEAECRRSVTYAQSIVPGAYFHGSGCIGCPKGCNVRSDNKAMFWNAERDVYSTYYRSLYLQNVTFKTICNTGRL